MEERKSMGGAIVDVFDAGVTLVKSEINALVKKVSDIAKAKGVGVVLLLAATGPLILALIFLILAVFYGLMRLGLGAWAAALLIAIFSFVVTGVMILLGIRKLGAEVETDEPTTWRSGPMTEDERLEAQYQAEQAEKAARERRAAQAQTAPAQTTQVQTTQVQSGQGRISGGAAVTSPTSTVVISPSPTPRGAAGAAGVGMGASVQRSADNTQARMGAPDLAQNQDSRQPASRTSVEVPRDTDLYAGGENRLVGESGKQATVRVEGGTSTVPVYESEPDGSARMYGGSLNEKLDTGEVASANRAETGAHRDTHHGHDPLLQDPVVLDDAPGISVSTTPTYQDDIKKGGGHS